MHYSEFNAIFNIQNQNNAWKLFDRSVRDQEENVQLPSCILKFSHLFQRKYSCTYLEKIIECAQVFYYICPYSITQHNLYILGLSFMFIFVPFTYFSKFSCSRYFRKRQHNLVRQWIQITQLFHISVPEKKHECKLRRRAENWDELSNFSQTQHKKMAPPAGQQTTPIELTY